MSGSVTLVFLVHDLQRNQHAAVLYIVLSHHPHYKIFSFGYLGLKLAKSGI